MYRSIVAISVMLLVACGSSKPKYATEEELQQYTGSYYITFTFTPKNIHPMTMGGIGDTFEIEVLSNDNLDDFIESFFEQFIYTPILLSAGYWRMLECLGLSKERDMVNWHNNFHLKYSTSNLIEEYKLKLQDDNYIVIRKYRLLGDLDVKYVEDYKDCIMSSSIELDINKIKSIDKVAVLLDKE